jgi:hypothetical protein
VHRMRLTHADLRRNYLERLVIASVARTGPQAAGADSNGAEWDCEWAATKAAEALRVLGRNYPGCLEALRALDVHEQAANEGADRGAVDGYLEVLRNYGRAGGDAALEMRRWAA